MVFNDLISMIGDSGNILTCDYPDRFKKEQVDGFLNDVFRKLKACHKGQRIFVIGYSMGASVGFDFIKKLESHGFTVDLFVVVDKEIQVQKSFESQLEENINFLHESFQGTRLPKSTFNLLSENLKFNTLVGSQFVPSGSISANSLLVSCGESFNPGVRQWQSVTVGAVDFLSLNCGHNNAVQGHMGEQIIDSIDKASKHLGDLLCTQAR